MAAIVCFAALASAQEPGRGRQPISVPDPPNSRFAPPLRAPTQVSRAVGTSAQTTAPVVQAQYMGAIGSRPPAPGEAEDERQGVRIQLEVPGLERLLLSLTNDQDLFERIRQETLKDDPMQRVTFPEAPILSRDRYFGRGAVWPQRGVVVEPYFVNYNKLYFEDKNSERYGWELGMLQTFLSPLIFYADVALLPMKSLADPCNKMESSVGYCLPGDPTPYRLYPPEITLLGLAGEAASVMALVVMFP